MKKTGLQSKNSIRLQTLCGLLGAVGSIGSCAYLAKPITEHFQEQDNQNRQGLYQKVEDFLEQSPKNVRSGEAYMFADKVGISTEYLRGLENVRIQVPNQVFIENQPDFELSTLRNVFETYKDQTYSKND
ncbi:MAG: hypothetical protein ACMXYA_02270 [Candidatus Woesearchaeota archaeon]